MQYSRNILIISPPNLARSQNLVDICGELEAANFGCTRFELKDLSEDVLPSVFASVVLLNFPDTEISDSRLLIERLRAQYGIETPIIGTLQNASDTQLCGALTSTLFAPTHPVQIMRRIQSVLRINKVKEEIQMRVKTLSDMSGSQSQSPAAFEAAFQRLAPTSKPMRVLFVGKANTEFMTIMNALQDHNVEIIAAFTSFTAFDYLHEGTFNAVVINAQEDHETALSITSTMRRNSKLFSVPALVLVKDGNLPDQTSIVENGVNDILTVGSSSVEISGRILELANFHRAHETLKSMYSSLGTEDSLDKETGLFNAKFFESHLKRNFAHAQSTDTALNIVVFKVVISNTSNSDEPPNPASIKSALHQIGVMLKSIVRVQDCSARLSTSQFAIIFPGKTREDTAHVTQRIQEIIACTSFDCNDDTLKVSVKVKIMQVHTPSTPSIAKSA